MAKERIKTFVDGFDKHLGGGIPKNHVVLLAGTAGTMKSSLAYNILYHNAVENGMNGAYFSLEQDRESLVEHMEGLGLTHANVQDKVSLLDLSKTRLETEDYGLRKSWSFIIRDLIETTKRERGLDILVLDSLNIYETIAGVEDPRIELFEFFKWLRGLNATSFLISEMSMDSKEFARHGADFLADGIIHMALEMVDDIHSHRRIKVVKMRGCNHSTDFFALIFGSGKFRIPMGIADVWK
ncbi:MAG: ATPase domain-containing protein [Halobacteria archaeon]|jgi:circadian clock protein KaiC